MKLQIPPSFWAAIPTIFLILDLPQTNLAAAVDANATRELILTPYIKTGNLDMARAASEDNFDRSKIKNSVPVKSFSGYLTVNETTDSNLFFWFFPAMDSPAIAPVILWVNESPGQSSLASIFLETGPFSVGENQELLPRQASWTRNYSMLYIDAPVGSGFSYATEEEGFALTSDDEADEVYEALLQFFTIFKEYQSLDFYLAGKQYAGAFIPHIASKIHEENSKDPTVKINMKGFILSSPWLDIPNQSMYARSFHDLGLVDERERDEILALEEKFQHHVATGNVFGELGFIDTVIVSKDSALAKYTGFESLKSAIKARDPPELKYFEKFIESQEVQNYLHVGLHQFVKENWNTFAFFVGDFFTSHVDKLESLLDKDYKVLVIAPQFNLRINPASVERVLKGLKWKGLEDFKGAQRTVWRSGGDVAGYVRQSGNLVHVLLRNAGANAFMDQPEWTLDLLGRFIHDRGYQS